MFEGVIIRNNKISHHWIFATAINGINLVWENNPNKGLIVIGTEVEMPAK